MKPLVSVNLLLYKPRFYLEPCLWSIFEQTYENFELLIIDNASGDDTARRVDEIISAAQQADQKLPLYRIIGNAKNLGFAGGHNQGIKESRGELVVMVNQDLILDRDFLSNIIEVFKDERVGSAQGKLLRLKVAGQDLSQTDIIDNTGLVILKNRRIIARHQGKKDAGQFNKTEEIFGADGALPVYRRAALEDAKISLDGQEEYFDKDFFAYKEDVDLAWRLRLYGWQAFYEPKALAWHARTSGDSEARNYLAVIRKRLKINKFSKHLSFKNQRLMQIKNERWGLLFRHALWFFPKEIGAWLYVLVFEHYTWRAIKDLFKQAPRAWQKRKIIMACKKVGGEEMKKWFV